MPDENKNLYLFEAIELRKEYDCRIKLMEELLAEENNGNEGLFSSREEDEKEPAPGFDAKKIEMGLKNQKIKRMKLNQAVQEANFKYQIELDGESITIAEALDLRKNLLEDLKSISRKVIGSAYKRIIHKEKRDIVKNPRQPFQKTYDSYTDTIEKIRDIITSIHIANHNNIVTFREE